MRVYSNDRASICGVDVGGSVRIWRWLRVIMVQEEEEVVGVSVHNWHIRIKRTTLHGFRALLSIGLGIRVAIQRVANHLARGSR